MLVHSVLVASALLITPALAQHSVSRITPPPVAGDAPSTAAYRAAVGNCPPAPVAGEASAMTVTSL